MNDSTTKRFWNKVNILSDDECWIWQAAHSSGGYGSIGIDGKIVGAHRVAFEIANGYKPNICRHTCDNPPCVNPKHLLDGTQKDNMMDCAQKMRIHNGNTLKIACPKGHIYDLANTRISKQRKYVGGLCRQCRVCDRNRKRILYEGIQ